MLLFWRIQYLDTRDRQFKDRVLWLETNTLDPVTKIALEATHELKDVVGHSRRMLRYRHLFHEKRYSEDELSDLYARHDKMESVHIHNYSEDENGKELTSKEVAVALTGYPDAVMVPASAKQHDIDYIRVDKHPIPIDQISLSQKQLNVLGYFVRDMREMLASAFYKDGHGSLVSSGGNDPVLQTAVTDEEIRSFISIFRRLYMKREPANFLKAVAAFGEVIQGYPLASWVKGIAEWYKKELSEKPDFVPMIGHERWSFSRKRLIDVYLYTQYAHQPDEKGIRQFRECLDSVGGKQPLLTWLFLRALWGCALHMRNAGVVITDFYDRYCQYHEVSADIIESVYSDNPGIGTTEKKEARQARILREKAEELAMELWKKSDRPEGGPTQFFNEARTQLNMAMTAKSGAGEEAF